MFETSTEQLKPRDEFIGDVDFDSIRIMMKNFFDMDADSPDSELVNLMSHMFDDDWFDMRMMLDFLKVSYKDIVVAMSMMDMEFWSKDRVTVVNRRHKPLYLSLDCNGFVRSGEYCGNVVESKSSLMEYFGDSSDCDLQRHMLECFRDCEKARYVSAASCVNIWTMMMVYDHLCPGYWKTEQGRKIRNSLFQNALTVRRPAL